jgi:membrane-bound ClpP family serine protease
VPGVQDGQIGLFPTSAARDVGLCKATAETREEVRDLYGLPPTAPRDDPLGGRSPDVYYWEIRKDIDNSLRESVGRVVRDVQHKGGNVLILVINAGGNDLDAARGLADDLRAAQAGEKPIKVVAFVPESAPAAGTVVALGCTEIVMTRTKPDESGEVREAEIGDFSKYRAQQAVKDAQLTSIRDLAEKQGYPGVLVDGMFKEDLEILRVRPVGNNVSNQRRFMTREQFEAEKARWSEDKVVKPKGQLLKLPATLAVEYGFARLTVDGTQVKAVTAAFGWPDARSADPGWLDRFAEFLKLPVVTVLLVVIGFTGLILELKVPGLTVPGIIAALCFILVFWAHSKFSGQTFVLALMLFLLGLVLVGIELFVLPGFGACGISGIVAMLAGLALVTLEKVPQTPGEWGDLGVRVSYYMVAMLGAIVLAFFIARFLPSLPGANRLVLNAPADSGTGAENLPGAGEAAELLGAIGTTNTPLRPAGVVKFGDKFVDVVSDGGFVPAGTRVQVIQVEGTRIVVKEV